jgi:hypothetical protein
MAIRFHIGMILLGTLTTVWAANKLLLHADVTYMALRYGLATIAGYAIFVALSALWLKYLGRRSKMEASHHQTDAVTDAPPEIDTTIPATGGKEPWSGGGGGFSGAGASGSYAEDAGSDWSPIEIASLPLPDFSADSVDVDDVLELHASATCGPQSALQSPSANRLNSPITTGLDFYARQLNRLGKTAGTFSN